MAVKIIDKTRLDDDTSRLLSREISCMERLSHENLIQLFEVHESFSRLCLVMECAGEGDLQSRVADNGPFSEDKARAVFTQMAAGINHMVGYGKHCICMYLYSSALCLQHTSGVCHRDLKPENVLYVSNTQIKIGDFGFSTPFTDVALSTFCGSPAFAAPELLQEQKYLGPPVDIWALGATLYYMVTGNIPFTGGTVPQIKESVLKGSYNPPKRVGTLCKELVAKLLAIQASDRPSIAAILQDAWLEGVKEATDPGTTNVVDEIVTQMRELGVPVGEDTSYLLGEPRCAKAGTYRILLHRRLLTHSQPKDLDTCTQEPNLTNSIPVHGKSRACTIL